LVIGLPLAVRDIQADGCALRLAVMRGRLPLSQITPAKRHHPKRSSGKNTPIVSAFVTCFVKHRTGKSPMMPVLNGFPREREMTAPGQLAERYTPKSAPQNLPACALAAGNMPMGQGSMPTVENEPVPPNERK
jgi:hypothetical protein